MNLFDYLNSEKGSKLVGVYGCLITILTFNVTYVMMCYRSNWTDVPTGAGALVLTIIAAVLGSHLAEKKIAQKDPDSPTQ